MHKHSALQVDADTPQGTVPNIADIIHGTPPAPGTEAKVIAKIKAIVRARAVVKVLKRVQARRPARARPPFTG